VRVLVLLDIDGTLLSAFGEGRLAYYEALSSLFPGREWPWLEMAGRTDFGIWCELTGLAEGEEWESFKDLYARTMEQRLAHRPPERLPGVESLCRALAKDPRFQIGIVTGNLEEGTRIKLRHGGLHHWFTDVPGAYGDGVHDKDGQARLVVESERAGCGGSLRAVVVGDTLADLRCALFWLQRCVRNAEQSPGWRGRGVSGPVRHGFGPGDPPPDREVKRYRYRLHGLAMEPSDPGDPLEKALRDWRIPSDALVHAQILRESLDARRSNHPLRKLTLELVTSRPFRRHLLEPIPEPAPDEDDLLVGSLHLPGTVHVVGSGPCGIGCAIGLSEKGYRVVLHERGADLATRSMEARRFLKGGDLDPETNFLYGEGGAGTFTDGKLTTRTRNRLVQAALKLWVDCGEDPSIQWKSKPHLGTDRMRLLVAALRKRFLASGGEVRFLSRLEDIGTRDGRLVSGTFSGVTESVEAMVLAVGHSARDTWRMLGERGVPFQAKDFAAGVRIEHPQELIDRRQYGPEVDARGWARPSISFPAAPAGPGSIRSACVPGARSSPPPRIRPSWPPTG